jgi:hypothetical protein
MGLSKAVRTKDPRLLAAIKEFDSGGGLDIEKLGDLVGVSLREEDQVFKMLSKEYSRNLSARQKDKTLPGLQLAALTAVAYGALGYLAYRLLEASHKEETSLSSDP